MRTYHVCSLAIDEHSVTDLFRRDKHLRAMRQDSVHAGVRVVDPDSAGLAAARKYAFREWDKTAKVQISADGRCHDGSPIFKAYIRIEKGLRFAEEIRFAIRTVD